MPSSKNVYLILHGGLGNQLFQFFRALLILIEHPNSKLFLIERFLNEYSVSRDYELDPILRSSIPHNRSIDANLILKMRLPKLVSRALFIREPVLQIPGYGLIVDGYFQSEFDYLKISPNAIEEALSLLRKLANETSLIDSPIRNQVHHLRLTDFYKTKEDARVFVVDFLNKINNDIDIITDDESLFEEELHKLNPIFQVKIIPTKECSAWDLIRIFSKYKKIFSNGSSLAFWASVLSGNDFQTTNLSHQKMWLFLTKHNY